VRPTDPFTMTGAESMIIYDKIAKDYKNSNFKNYKGRTVKT